MHSALCPSFRTSRLTRITSRLTRIARAILPLLLAASLGPAWAQGGSREAEPVAALDAGLIRVMQAGRATPFQTRVAMLAPVVQSSFDLDLILRNSIGSRYAGFPEAQRSELRDSFTQFTVASYVANFDSYSGERFDILPEQRQVGADTVVSTRLVAGASEQAKLDYVVHATGGGFRIADVLLDGSISRVAVQRSDFRTLVAGGDPAPLIEMLRRKVASFAAGAKN